MKISFYLLLFFIHTALYAQSEYKIYLIGDAGEPYFDQHPNMLLLKKQLEEAGEASAVIFLGDNIYPKGMPVQRGKERNNAEKVIVGQLRVLERYQGRIVFLPGNHDWQKGSANGLERILQQEKFIETNLNRGNVFLPDTGCPGPVALKLTDWLVAIVYDSQWLLHPHEKPGKENDCAYGTSEEVFEGITSLLKQYEGHQVVVASHHPFITYGIHGGVTTLKDHLFPLTEAKSFLYLPLPVIGSLYPISRKLGNIQDTNHRVYQSIINALMPVFENYPGLIVTAGHEHSLQHSIKDQVHYVVSGAGVKTTHVRQKGYARFVARKTGFAAITFFQDSEKSPNLKFWHSDKIGEEKVLYQIQLNTETK